MLTTRGYWITSLLLFLGLSAAKGLYDRAVELTCWPGGYSQNAWMAYCNSERYGVYDAEAIWDGVEPEVTPAIHRAQVLTLSDSHLQNALSLGGASEWFASRGLSFYMLGVPTAESGFGERLLQRFHPHPKVLILDASPYFTGQLGRFEESIFSDPRASRDEILKLKAFQVRHQSFCEKLQAACGHNFAYFRSRLDGHWVFPAPSKGIWVGSRSVPNDERRYPTGSAPNELLPLYPQYLSAARRLVGQLQMPGRCVVIVHVPSADDLSSLARYLGTSLDLTVLDPRVPGLYTFDNAHLTPESSIRWTRAFLQQLEPVLERCIEQRPEMAVVKSAAANVATNAAATLGGGSTANAAKSAKSM